MAFTEGTHNLPNDDAGRFFMGLLGPDGNFYAPRGDGHKSLQSVLYGPDGNPLSVSSGQLQTRLYDGAGLSLNVGADGDGQSSSTQLVAIARSQAFNGATWDRLYNNAPGTLLASASRTATVSSPLQTNYNARGVVITLYVSVVGTGNLYLQVNGQEDGFGQQYVLLTNSPTPIVGALTYAWLLYPGLGSAPNGISGGVADVVLPRHWYGLVVKSDSSAWTFGLSYVYVD